MLNVLVIRVTPVLRWLEVQSMDPKVQAPIFTSLSHLVLSNFRPLVLWTTTVEDKGNFRQEKYLEQRRVNMPTEFKKSTVLAIMMYNSSNKWPTY
jgi:hypothetical protein